MQSSNGKSNIHQNHQEIHDSNTCHTLIRLLPLSHLDYCNSILVGCQKLNKCNAMYTKHHSKIILNKRSRDSTTEYLRELHWLPIQQRIHFKILILIFKSLNKQTPKYLQEHSVKKEQRRKGLRSNTKHNLLEIPTTFTNRAFSTYRPTKWNQLPYNLHTWVSLDIFKNH